MTGRQRKADGTMLPKTTRPAAPATATETAYPGSLASDISRLIAEARREAVVAANATLTLLYWRVGQRIGQEVLGGQQRADYGAEVIDRLADALVAQHGQGFTTKNLRHMLRFAQAWPDEQIVYALSRHLSWLRSSGCTRQLRDLARCSRRERMVPNDRQRRCDGMSIFAVTVRRADEGPRDDTREAHAQPGRNPMHTVAPIHLRRAGSTR